MEIRTVDNARFRGTLMFSSTRNRSFFREEQAEPVETMNPSPSRTRTRTSPGIGATETVRM
jgi:hypothetical protein